MSTDNSIERLLVYPKIYKNYSTQPYLHAGCTILNTATEAGYTQNKLKKSTQMALDFWKMSTENQVKRGMKRNEITKKDAVPTEIVVFIISIIEGVFMREKQQTELST